MRAEKITSLQNPKVKNVLKLRKAGERAKQQRFSIEGINELTHALHSGYEIETLFFCPDIAPQEEIDSLAQKCTSVYEVSREVFSKMAYREDSGGMVAISKQKDHGLANLKLRTNPLVIVLETVEKPGNLGAILRTADSASVDAVILCDASTDLYNPNVIRASIGCVFSTQVASCSGDEARQWLENNQIKSFATHIQTEKWYHEYDYRAASAIIMGTESTGLSEKWIRFAHEGIKIPMLGVNDSLNVSIATAVVVYEAMRQRNFYF
ncbi:MAG: RNA methyltransferase [Bacteroidales bacterium]|nr:RNA methyltransferase [Bacteroidales bacterium]